MAIEILTCEQGSDEWKAARLGLATASAFATIQAKGRGGGESTTRRKYLLTLAAERMTGESIEGYSNDHMERGKEMEAEAREQYAFTVDTDPQLVGFIRDTVKRAGCSPDALVGSDGLVEIKTKLPHLQIDVLLDDRLPPEHVAQVQGALWVSGRKWVDFVSYWPKLPIFIKRVYRDEDYIAKLAIAVQDFNDEMDSIVERFK
jgi:hypothetical protein